MGQAVFPSAGQIIVVPTDREAGPGAGAGATGNRTIFLGQGAGAGSSLSDVIVLGNNALPSNVTDVTNLQGTTVVGSGSLPVLTSGGTIGNTPGAMTVLGFGVAPAMQFGSASVLLGDQVLGGTTVVGGTNGAVARNVFIGTQAGQFLWSDATNATVDSVAIGWRAGRAVTQSTGPADKTLLNGAVVIGSGAAGAISHGAAAQQVSNTVAIGFNAINNSGSTGSVITSVYIGQGAGQNIPSSSQTIAIGAACLTAGTQGDNVAIGYSIGGGVQVGTKNVLIGNLIRAPGTTFVDARNIIIGYGANSGANVYTDKLLIETDNGTKRTAIFGDMSLGALVLGNSVQGTNRDIQGTNTVKIINGTVGGAAPLGGGYFYVTGGVLHWVDSNNVDTQVSLTASGQLAASALVAYSNNAGAAAGTLTNAPAAGNPTKWIPVNDNGTIRNIPAW